MQGERSSVHTIRNAVTSLKATKEKKGKIPTARNMRCGSVSSAEAAKAWSLRHKKKRSWREIANVVVNIRGQHPSHFTVRNVVNRLQAAKKQKGKRTSLRL